jgi:small subunit ribosomal protein S7
MTKRHDVTKMTSLDRSTSVHQSGSQEGEKERNRGKQGTVDLTATKPGWPSITLSGDAESRQDETLWGMKSSKDEQSRIQPTMGVPSVHAAYHPRMGRRHKELMRGGKAEVADRRIHEARRYLRQYKKSRDVRARRLECLEGLMPSVETTSVKVGGSIYQVPHPLDVTRREAYAVRWLVDGARSRLKKDGCHGMGEALALEVLAVHGDRQVLKTKPVQWSPTSSAVAQRQTVHRTSKVNRVSLHRRWR